MEPISWIPISFSFLLPGDLGGTAPCSRSRVLLPRRRHERSGRRGEGEWLWTCGGSEERSRGFGFALHRLLYALGWEKIENEMGLSKTNIKEKKKEIIPSPVSPIAKIAITLLYLFISKFFSCKRNSLFFHRRSKCVFPINSSKTRELVHMVPADSMFVLIISHQSLILFC